MAARTVVSYDDITLPYDQPEQPVQPPKHSGGQPPSKRRKKNQKAKYWDNSSNAKNGASYSQPRSLHDQHDINSKQDQNSVPDGEDEWDGGEGEGEYDEEEESRDLTHEEIWDDSALVDAWESAMEEYKAYHGCEDDWKKGPVKKSPLWYNVPVDPSKKKANNVPATIPTVTVPIIPAEQVEEAEDGDSQPLDFDTFVPTHDTSLQAAPTANNPLSAEYIPETPAGSMVSQDEAFSRALSAMYWGGYWTAMYHAQRQMTAPNNPTIPGADVDGDGEVEDVDDNEIDDELEEFSPTQR